MRKGTLIGAVLTSLVCILWMALPGFAARPFSTRQQASPEQKKPVPAEIVLPPQLETDKPATLAVLDAEGHLETGVNVSLSIGRQVRTDATGRARFVVTGDSGVFSAFLAGTDIRASAQVLPPEASSPVEIFVTNYPQVVALGDHIVVRGSGFRGDADVNQATLGGHAMLVLASSPVSLVLQPGPDAPAGTADLVVEVGGKRSGQMPLTLVSLDIERPGAQLGVGKKGQIVVHVNGTEQKLVLTVRNLSPNVVALTGGNSQRVTSSGGKRNAAVIPLRALSGGDFAVSVRMVPAGSDE